MITADFYDDKKYAFEDVDVALENVKSNLRELLREMRPEDRADGFAELMTMMPFAEYDLSFDDLGDI